MPDGFGMARDADVETGHLRVVIVGTAPQKSAGAAAAAAEPPDHVAAAELGVASCDTAVGSDMGRSCNGTTSKQSP